MHKFSLLLFIGCLFWTSCEETTYTPRPHGFPKVEYPEGGYQTFDEGYCNFTFEYPTYASIEQDTRFFDEAPAHPCWFDVYYPDFDSRIHFTYYPLKNNDSFEKLKGDAFALAGKHNVRADYIDELRIEKPNQVSGFAFDIKGEAASPFQFYLTDSTNHYLRGALYFNAQARPDSLAPVYDFVKADIMHMINTFEWE